MRCKGLQCTSQSHCQLLICGPIRDEGAVQCITAVRLLAQHQAWGSSQKRNSLPRLLGAASAALSAAHEGTAVPGQIASVAALAHQWGRTMPLGWLQLRCAPHNQESHDVQAQPSVKSLPPKHKFSTPQTNTAPYGFLAQPWLQPLTRHAYTSSLLKAIGRSCTARKAGKTPRLYVPPHPHLHRQLRAF